MLSDTGEVNLAKDLASGLIHKNNYERYYKHLAVYATGNPNMTYEGAMRWAYQRLQREVNSYQHLMKKISSQGYGA